MIFKRAFVGPRILQISLPSGCNHNCPFCITDIHGKGSIKNRKTMSVEEIKKTISQASKEYTLKYNLVSNGEPLMYPQIKEVTDHILKVTRGHGAIKIITNGTLIEKLGIDYINENDIELWLSLHSGDFETWNKCHQSLSSKPEEQFKLLKENLKKLTSPITLHSVMSTLNHRNISSVLDFARETNSYKLNFSRAQKFDEYDFNSETIEELRIVFEELRTSLSTEKFQHNLDAYLSEHMEVDDEQEADDFAEDEEGDDDKPFYESNGCYFNFIMALVDDEGNYGFCGTGPWMGNLKEENFGDIYKGKSHELRSKAVKISQNGGELAECKCEVCPHKDINIIANKYTKF